MRFLTNLLWILLAVIAALFAARNWDDVTVALWGQIQLDIKLPLLMLLLVLLGAIPTWAVMRTKHWRKSRTMPREVPAAPGANNEDEA